MRKIWISLRMHASVDNRLLLWVFMRLRSWAGNGIEQTMRKSDCKVLCAAWCLAHLILKPGGLVRRSSRLLESLLRKVKAPNVPMPRSCCSKTMDLWLCQRSLHKTCWAWTSALPLTDISVLCEFYWNLSTALIYGITKRLDFILVIVFRSYFGKQQITQRSHNRV